MACCHHTDLIEGGERVFSVDVSAISFGAGALAEVGDAARGLGLKRLALFTDKGLSATPFLETTLASLKAAGCDPVVYDGVKVEPTDQSFLDATRFAKDGRFDGFVSLGGGSVIDTGKAANLYSSHPADFLTYVNAPIGAGQPVPGPIKPHIACPTTCGTGSECTGIAIFDLLSIKAKTGIASRHLRPSKAIIDPLVSATLPDCVVAFSGFDVLSHALESYTARPFTQRAASAHTARPMSQGANPWSDLGCREALRLAGLYLVRAVQDADDQEARHGLMWAATLAGIAFGNAGVHVPHGMAYAVAGLVKDYHPAGFPCAEAIIPHGLSVIVNAPAVFRKTAPVAPARHLDCVGLLGGPTDATPGEAGEALSERLVSLMKSTGIPSGLADLGYGREDIAPLTAGAFPQRRLMENAPLDLAQSDLAELFTQSLQNWT